MTSLQVKLSGLLAMIMWVILMSKLSQISCDQVFQSQKPLLKATGLLGTLRIQHNTGPALGLDCPAEQPKPQFEPYALNGGTIAAIAGKGYVVLAADTRLARGYNILSRNVSRIAQVTENVVMGTGGCWSDFSGLLKQLQYTAKKYLWENRKPLSVQSFSTLLFITLYQRRLFPYYAFNIVAGLDDSGMGAVYSYDAIGSYQRVPAACTGTAQHLLQPTLDLICADMAKDHLDLTLEEAVQVLKEIFIAGSEREIHLGDQMEIVIIQESHGVTRQFQQLASH
mmetsp:Transcript_12436/g.16067  ORF Transcript_12436/g.16067 Transcript_12436/m.16067 type:complete len:282 (+) Transcript_12436:55-900(+)